MAYSAEELEELKERINGALASGRLNAWQVNFLTDIRGRIDKSGRSLRLSDKQTAKLNEILSKAPRPKQYPRSPNVVSLSPRPQRRSYPEYRRRRSSRRFSMKIMAFAIFAVLMAGQALSRRTRETAAAAWSRSPLNLRAAQR